LAETLIREFGAVAPREFSIGGYLVKNGEQLWRFVDARTSTAARLIGSPPADVERENVVTFIQDVRCISMARFKLACRDANLFTARRLSRQ
jgi:hypothetical protein